MNTGNHRETHKKNAHSNKRSWCNYPHLLLSQIQRRSQQDAAIVREAHATFSSTINPYASLYIHTSSINSPKLYFNISFINFISISLSISLSITLGGLSYMYWGVNNTSFSNPLFFQWFKWMEREILSLYTNQKHIQLSISFSHRLFQIHALIFPHWFIFLKSFHEPRTVRPSKDPIISHQN